MLARLLPLAIACAPVLGADVYVDASANCGLATGSPARPFCTISEGLAAAGPSDAVLVRPGTYPETLLVARDARIVGIGGAASTVIDGGGAGSVITNQGARLELQGLTIEGGLAWLARHPDGLAGAGPEEAQELSAQRSGPCMRRRPSPVARSCRAMTQATSALPR